MAINSVTCVSLRPKVLASRANAYSSPRTRIWCMRFTTKLLGWITLLLYTAHTTDVYKKISPELFLFAVRCPGHLPGSVLLDLHASNVMM